MKLSDAILLGSTLAPQTFCQLYNHTTHGTCAIGAALDAVGRLSRYGDDVPQTNVATVWPWLRQRDHIANCPERGCEMRGAYGLIVHLNDCHEWPREKIAAFVATIEPKEDHGATNDVMAQGAVARLHPPLDHVDGAGTQAPIPTTPLATLA